MFYPHESCSADYSSPPTDQKVRQRLWAQQLSDRWRLSVARLLGPLRRCALLQFTRILGGIDLSPAGSTPSVEVGDVAGQSLCVAARPPIRHCPRLDRSRPHWYTRVVNSAKRCHHVVLFVAGSDRVVVVDGARHVE